MLSYFISLYHKTKKVDLVFMLFLSCAWLTHVVKCFEDDSWAFLIAGALMYPIGIVHGLWLWF